MVCAADMPFVTAGACRALEEGAAVRPEAAAAVAFADGRSEPLLGVYRPQGLAVLRAAPPDAPLTVTVEQLGPVHVTLPPGVTRSVNTPEQLRTAEAELLRSG
jgi:molybdopterin-guanine dinucleotide biosynthesis protein A